MNVILEERNEMSTITYRNLHVSCHLIENNSKKITGSDNAQFDKCLVSPMKVNRRTARAELTGKVDRAAVLFRDSTRRGPTTAALAVVQQTSVRRMLTWL